MSKKLLAVLGLLVVLSMLLVACGGNEVVENNTTDTTTDDTNTGETTTEETEEPDTTTEEPVATEEPEPTEEPVVRTTRVGGWLDTIAMSVVDGASVVTQIEAGAVDLYGSDLSTPQDIAAIEAAGLERSQQFGIYYELSFNPVGPTFDATGKLNPFSNAMCRDAMNYLVDRDYINQEIYGGNAVPKFTPFLAGFPDYANYIDIIRGYETKYAPNRDKAVEEFTTCMTDLGAEMVDGKWNFNGEPVEVIFLIRTDSDGTRLPMGDIISNWLEEVGFTVTRQYGTSSELSPIWVLGNMQDGLFHIYTGAWGATGVSRNDADNFQFFYSPASGYGFSDLWQNYNLSEEDEQLFTDLANNNFTTLEERREMFEKAFEAIFKYNFRVWVADGRSSSVWAPNVSTSYDLGAGVDSSATTPFTVRFKDQEGGTLRFAEPDLFVDPANPISGSNWTYDAVWQNPTQSGDALPNPYTGLTMPLRVERAEVTVLESLPVVATLDWVDLSTSAEEITVPGDTWLDWNPETETFITADEKYPDGLTAKAKAVLYYPEDLWDITWHDGSQLSVGDFVMAMIMGYATGTEGSSIYDAAQAPSLEAALQTFKGYRILSTDPLVIEKYTDTWYFDAELIAAYYSSFWPDYGYGEASWHALAVSNKAEASGELAYSSDKADELEVEWMNYIGGPSLEILASKLDEAIAENTIPFEATMGQYVSADEAAARYANLKAFYEEYGHFWVGTGPYILKDVFQVEKALTLVHNPNYPDLADRWSIFSEPMIAEVAVDGAGRVTIGEEATFDVFLTFKGDPYPADQVKEVKYLVFNADSEVVEVGFADLVTDGQYMITLTSETTSKLVSGANKLEAVALVFPTAQPSIAAFEFVSE